MIKDLNLTFKGQIILIKLKLVQEKTILNLLTGLIDPDEGSIRIDKLDIKYNLKKLSRFNLVYTSRDKFDG